MEVNNTKPTYTYEEGVKLFELDRHYNAIGWPKHYTVYDEDGVEFIDRDIPNGSIYHLPMDEAPVAYFYNGEWVKK